MHQSILYLNKLKHFNHLWLHALVLIKEWKKNS